jgi:hypothetical protein
MRSTGRDIKKCKELIERKKKLEWEIMEFPLAIKAQARYGVLEPCPLCGGEPDMEDRLGLIRVVCRTCNIEFRVSRAITTPMKAAIDGWNRTAADMGVYEG